nr:transposase [Flavonifractor sp. An9]
MALGQDALDKALRSLLEPWPYLTRYLEDGRLEFSNDCAERSIKPFIMGRKNWRFFHPPTGIPSSALICNIIETAKQNGLDPFRYLVWFLHNTPG